MRTNHWSLFIAALIFTENCCLEEKKNPGKKLQKPLTKNLLFQLQVLRV